MRLFRRSLAEHMAEGFAPGHLDSEIVALGNPGDPITAAQFTGEDAPPSDTADLAVDAIIDWWRLSQPNYPQATRLMIEADGGGSNAARSRRYKKWLQEFADASGLEITVCHYPPGTSKWNPIEHRLFSQITATWAGYVLSTLMVLLGWIRRTTTRTGLKVTAAHFDKHYETGLKVTKAEFQAIQITRNTVCPQWNYTIRPQLKNTE